MKGFFKRLFCFHRHKTCWKVLRIGWGGETIVQCSRCGAVKEVPLRAPKGKQDGQ